MSLGKLPDYTGMTVLRWPHGAVNQGQVRSSLNVLSPISFKWQMSLALFSGDCHTLSAHSSSQWEWIPNRLPNSPAFISINLQLFGYTRLEWSWLLAQEAQPFMSVQFFVPEGNRVWVWLKINGQHPLEEVPCPQPQVDGCCSMPSPVCTSKGPGDNQDTLWQRMVRWDWHSTGRSIPYGISPH